MRKKTKYLKKSTVIIAAIAMLALPIMANALYVTTSVSTSNAGLTVSATGIG